MTAEHGPTGPMQQRERPRSRTRGFFGGLLLVIRRPEHAIPAACASSLAACALLLAGACGSTGDRGGDGARAPEPTAEPLSPDDWTASLRASYARPPAEWPAPAYMGPEPYRELGPVSRGAPPEDPAGSARVALGRALFFDARLSGTGQMACASCHDAELGWADGRATSFGHGFHPLPRNAPSLLNVAHGTSFFWDGRAATLEDQALAVFENPGEMHSSGEAVVSALSGSSGYRTMFQAAWGRPEPTLDLALSSLAAFERTLVSDGSSDFDRFLAGDAQALEDEAVRGLHLFRTKAHCVNCHNGPLLSDGAFHEVGLSYYGRELEDLGRYRVTQDPADVGRFKTPSLRNVGRTAPYMHNGLFELDGVLNMYDAGMPTLKRKPEQAGDPLFPVKSPLLRPLGLTRQEKADLKAFLLSLTERRRRVRPPELPALGDHAG